MNVGFDTFRDRQFERVEKKCLFGEYAAAILIKPTANCRGSSEKEGVGRLFPYKASKSQ